MIKVLFLTSGLTHGGVNKSLLNLINLIDKQKYDIDIFPIYREGPYKDLLKDYNVISVNEILPALFPLNILLKRRSLRTYLTDKAFDWLTKIAIHLFPKMYAKRVSRIFSPEKYNAVISFQEGYTTELATYIKSPIHIAWVHCDYSRYFKNKKKDESRIYDMYSYIVAVSEYTASVFRKCVPSVSNKVKAIHNIMDQNDIIEHSNEKPEDDRFIVSPLNLISIGRMDPVKRFALIPEIAGKLIAKGIPFKWYIIGDGGSEKEKVENAIKEYQTEDTVILLGAKNNPYPYIVNSSVLVCLSSSEACPNVVNEGRILHIPVVVADFPSANEFIVSGENGFISPVEKISDILIQLYENNDVYNKIIENIKEYHYDNTEIMRRITSLFS